MHSSSDSSGSDDDFDKPKVSQSMPRVNVPLKPVREEDSDDDDGVPMEAPFSPTDEFEVIGSIDLKKAKNSLGGSMVSSSADPYNMNTKNQRASMGSSGLNSSVLMPQSSGMIDLSPTKSNAPKKSSGYMA